MPRRQKSSSLSSATPKPSPAPKPVSVPLQQADFTSEGAPPPGRVGSGPPELKPKTTGAKAPR